MDNLLDDPIIQKMLAIGGTPWTLTQTDNGEYWIESDDMVVKITTDNEANARLIAQSPLMYELLSDMYIYFDTDAIANPSAEMDKKRAMFNKRIEAILKATS